MVEKQEATGSPVSKPFHPERAVCDCERLGLDESAECVHDDPCFESEAAYVRAISVKGKYPKGAVDTAISALELSYSYLRDKSVIGERVTDALDRLYRYREIETGQKHPYRDLDTATSPKSPPVPASGVAHSDDAAGGV